MLRLLVAVPAVLLAAATTVANEDMAIDFDAQIVPVLTKSGCNAGACHGAAAGRGGFGLSLYGGNPAADYEAIVQHFEGRRVNLARPADSLLIAKPTEVLNHGGGGRLEYEGDGAKLLEAWIAAGAKRGPGRPLVEFSVSPPLQIVDAPAQSVQLRACARFEGDGEAIDVTRWTVLTAEDPAAVQIDEMTGKTVVVRRGRHVVIARYLDRVVPVEIIVPLSNQSVDLSASPRKNFIDDLVLEKLATLRIPPSPQCDNATFLRRLRLDLTGRLPLPEEVTKFLTDKSPDKRERLIDKLLDSEEFVEFFTYQLAKLLRIRPPGNDEAAGLAFHGWLKKQVERGTPYDQMARELMLAEGDSHDYGPANFYRLAPTARDQAEYVSELLMGVRLRCANCHNHPLDQWTQDDYHGLAAVFARLDRGRVVKPTNRGEVTHPRTGESAVPRIPGERFLEASSDGRAALADWLTAEDNHYFARAIVNRLWKMLLGRGLIEPADDLRATNPATHPELLNRLAADFVENGYDLRHTLRRIANSAAYRRSSRSLPNNAADDGFFSHALDRPLPAEVLADAISDVTGVWDRYENQPPGTRAVSLFSPTIPSDALDILGRCDRSVSCETSADETAGGLSTTLHLINGPLVNRKITSPEGRLRKLIDAGRSNDEIVAEFYLRALGRRPTEGEAAHWRETLSRDDERSSRRQALEDFLWGLLNCREFVGNS